METYHGNPSFENYIREPTPSRTKNTLQYDTENVTNMKQNILMLTKFMPLPLTVVLNMENEEVNPDKFSIMFINNYFIVDLKLQPE
jgi:hypothetical protein